MPKQEKSLDEVIEQIHKDAAQAKALPIFDSVSNAFQPLMKSSKRIGALEALINLQGKLEALMKSRDYPSSWDLWQDVIQAIEQTRVETLKSNE
jgi:DNA polymerase III delta subunit